LDGLLKNLTQQNGNTQANEAKLRATIKEHEILFKSTNARTCVEPVPFPALHAVHLVMVLHLNQTELNTLKEGAAALSADFRTVCVLSFCKLLFVVDHSVNVPAPAFLRYLCTLLRPADAQIQMLVKKHKLVEKEWETQRQVLLAQLEAAKSPDSRDVTVLKASELKYALEVTDLRKQLAVLQADIARDEKSAGAEISKLRAEIEAQKAVNAALMSETEAMQNGLEEMTVCSHSRFTFLVVIASLSLSVCVNHLFFFCCCWLRFVALCLPFDSRFTHNRVRTRVY
jgi:hypothetical protein